MIGERLRDLRVAAGITQSELAEYLGLSPKMISFYELDQRNPPNDILLKLSQRFHVTTDYLLGVPQKPGDNPQRRPVTRIPVLGTIAAGTPITAVEETSEYIDLDPDLAARGEFFGLRVRGDSMSPDIRAGDIVICRKQDFVDDGKIAALLIGDEATVKQVKHTSGGMMLIGYNAAVFPPRLYSKHEVESIPVTVCGQVVQVRRDLW